MKTAPVVDRLWPDSTVVCLATGPSLTKDDAEFCRGKARVIAVNNAYTLAPWADCLYAADGKWWGWHKDAQSFAGLKYSIEPQHKHKASAVVLKNRGRHGLSLDPSGLCTGHNSGYQAINLAVHFGARRIVLLGYDMRGSHFFGAHPDKTTPAFLLCLQAFQTIVRPLMDLCIDVVNCSRQTALGCFRRATLTEVLA